MTARAAGFTLVEIAIVLVIIGLLIAAVLQGQELIRSARVRNLIAQQEAVKAAFLGFQDRYPGAARRLPRAATHHTSAAPCIDGNGNGLIEDVGAVPRVHPGVDASDRAGFLNASFTLPPAAPPLRVPAIHPTNPYGGYLQMIYDAQLGLSAATATDSVSQHQDRQPDPGGDHRGDRPQDRRRAAHLGPFQFSPYAAASGNATRLRRNQRRQLHQHRDSDRTDWNSTISARATAAARACCRRTRGV